MEEKYYTPTINEFHTDFEYEVLEKGNWIKKNDFSNAYDYEDSCLYGLIKDLEKGNIRVKYLDTKDIESFGWIEDKIFLLDDSTWFKLNSNYLRHYYHGELYIQNGNKEMIFNGVCKNKSELERVLKQIGFKEIK
jgi:hypothetical protein